MTEYYSCPYCEQTNNNEKHELVKKRIMDSQCEHGESFLLKGLPFLNKKCGKEDFKCKEVMYCESCDNAFRITEDFLSKQKRGKKNG